MKAFTLAAAALAATLTFTACNLTPEIDMTGTWSGNVNRAGTEYGARLQIARVEKHYDATLYYDRDRNGSFATVLEMTGGVQDGANVYFVLISGLDTLEIDGTVNGSHYAGTFQVHQSGKLTLDATIALTRQ